MPRRTWSLVLPLALIPILVTLASITSQGGLALVPDLAQSSGGWSRLALLVAGPALLTGLFTWMATTTPELLALRRRSLRLKRLVVAAASLLAAASFWMAVLVGDLAWRGAFGGVSGGEGSRLLETPAGWYLVLVGALGAGLYWLARPRGGRSRPSV